MKIRAGLITRRILATLIVVPYVLIRAGWEITVEGLTEIWTEMR